MGIFYTVTYEFYLRDAYERRESRMRSLTKNMKQPEGT